MDPKKRKFLWNGIVFTGIMLVTFWSIFRNQNLPEVLQMIRKLTFPSLIIAVGLAVAFVAAEGGMICFLLRNTGVKIRVFRCVEYSFIGFFFSGLTPSATGGQPMQLYYMKKDGIDLSVSSVVLMVVATIYKFVLVIIAAGIYVFWRGQLKEYLKEFYWLFFLGAFLNVLLVALLLMVMCVPEIIRSILYKAEKLLVRIKVLKASESRKMRIDQFLDSYAQTVCYLKGHKKVIAVTILGTFLQRSCMFVLTYVIYQGMGLQGTEAVVIILLQASIYIAVDMLPLPGAQGITEAMYRKVFENIFQGTYLISSMCITRGISFYLIMIISAVVWCRAYLANIRKTEEWIES